MCGGRRGIRIVCTCALYPVCEAWCSSLTLINFLFHTHFGQKKKVVSWMRTNVHLVCQCVLSVVYIHNTEYLECTLGSAG